MVLMGEHIKKNDQNWSNHVVLMNYEYTNTGILETKIFRIF